jgi:hypothetical protein
LLGPTYPVWVASEALLASYLSDEPKTPCLAYYRE